MTRRCSHCSANGHNSRTCPSRGEARPGATAACVKLFGVSITDGSSMKKSASMGCLSHNSSSSLSSASPSNRDDPVGYASDDPNHTSCSSNCRGERKKGTPWTEEEHRMFLVGLQKLGKGDWRGISRNYVMSRTPTQVASHAQKYFIRQTNATRRKRRSSLFDMVTDMPEDHVPVDEQLLPHSHTELEKANNIPLLDLNLEQESLAMETVVEMPMVDASENTACSNFSLVMPAFYPAYVHIPVPFWSPVASMPVEEPACEAHEVLKPTPILPKDRVHPDELVVMSKLSLGEALGDCMEPSALSSELHGDASSSRRSAFHASPAMPGAGMSQNSGNAIRAL